MNLARPIARPIARRAARLLGDYRPAAGGPIRLTEAAWEALTEYDWAQAYIVEGVGEYLGPTLVTPAAWAPAAGDYYVSKSGSDANNGLSEGAAKLTIASAFNAISTSNSGPITIWVDSGTYTENLSGGYFLFSNKAFAYMVTIRGKPGTLPIIINASGSYTIRPNGTCANVRFRNMKVQGASGSLGFVFYNGSSLTNFELVECVFEDTNSRPTAISFAGTGQSNIAVKRCTFTSAAAFGTSTLIVTGFKFIGNDYTNTLVATLATGGGTHTLNSNKISGPILLTGHASTSTSFQMYGNTCRNMAHTGGATGNRSTINFNRNTVDAGSGVKGVSVIGYFSSDSTFDDNTITALGQVGLAVPDDGGTSAGDGYTMRRNVITNNGTSGHAILLSTGSSNATVTDNVTFANAGGSYGAVIKGTGHTVTGNDLTGGGNSGVLFKDGSGHTFTANTVRSPVSGAVALRFDNATGCTITENDFIVSAGVLYSFLSAHGTGNVIDTNNYDLDSPATWGAMFSSNVNSLADVRAAWTANYASSPTNDTNSVAV